MKTINQRITPREVTPYEIGWLAGIIDGEGSLSFGKSKNKKSRFGFNYYNGIHIVNSNHEMIDKCVDIINRICEGIDGSHKMNKVLIHNKIYNVNNFKQTSNNKYKDCFQVTLRNKDWTIKILETVIPYLTEKRKKSIALLQILKERIELNRLAKLNGTKAFYTEGETERYMQIWNDARRD